MLKILIVASATIAVICSAWEYMDYCGVESCKGRPHTFWVFRTEHPAPACDKVIKVGLTEIEKRKILDLHNELRQKVARGEETRGKPGPQPPARNMRVMEWDDELATLAQRWANQCSYTNDQCRNSERFEVGQLVAEHKVKDDVMKVDVQDLVKIWYDQCDQFDATTVSNYNYKLEDKVALYTQMVWSNSYKLGCGAIRYPIPGYKRFLLVCNYGPTGNVKGQPVYESY